MLHKDTQRRKQWMQQVLHKWFAAHRRDFPWRREPRDPYVVLVAEVMLQQTQVWRVEPALKRFLERFPTLDVLARASKAELLRAWKGLGYNRRAVYLHACARAIVERYGGTIPAEYPALRSLPGIGDYTARAIMAFAYGNDVAVVDINVSRVLSRFFSPQPTEADLLPTSVVITLASALVPRGGARWWNEALMDVGSLYCTRRSPRCRECPLVQRCASVGKMQPGERKKKTEPLHRGIPRRLWRGKLLDVLRSHSPQTLDQCATALWVNPTAQDRAQLAEIVAQLAREGLIAYTAEGSIELPKE